MADTKISGLTELAQGAIAAADEFVVNDGDAATKRYGYDSLITDLAASSQTLTNKTIDADGTGNSITNIENADIKAAAAIAVNKLAALTASEIVISDGSGFISSAAVATYPSLTELSYVKGLSSAIQTQLNAKGTLSNVVEDVTPVLGADLDGGNFDITNVTDLTADGVVTLGAASLIVPATDGTASQAIVTDGAGNLSFSGTVAADVNALVLDVRKGSAGTISKGVPFYISGWNASGFAEVETADADDAAKMPAAGIADQNITNAATVSVVVAGNQTGMDTSGFSVGNQLYVNNDGTVTATKPALRADLVQKIGQVLRSHASLGVIQVVGAGRSNDIPNVLEPRGLTAAGDNAALGYSATEGLQLTGQGSTTDVTIKNDADATVLGIPTGTSNVTLGVDGTASDIIMTEKSSIRLDPAGGADGDYSGITFVGTAGATVAFGDVVYLKAADSEWYLADASTVATAGTKAIAICVSSGTDGNPVTLMTHGILRADAGFPALTIGAPVYISLTGTTTNTVTVTAPSATDEVVQIVGYALTADEMLFNPSPDHITIV